MANSKNILIGGVVLIVLAVSFIGYRVFKGKKGQVSCIEKVEQHTALDNHNLGVLGAGESYNVELGYYNCHDIGRADLVYYKAVANLDPTVRIVRAVAGDSFEISPTEDKQHWTISVNGQLVPFGESHFYFGNAKKPVLKHHEEHFEGKVPTGYVLLLTNIPRGNADSSSLGLIPTDTILGRVSLVK